MTSTVTRLTMPPPICAMTIYLASFFCLFTVAVLSFAVLMPLEFSLRQSNRTVLPRLGFPVRRIETEIAFDRLLGVFDKNPELFPIRVSDERFIVSTQNIRCIVERSMTGDRSLLTFRYPIGLMLFVTAIPLGVVIMAFEKVVTDPSKIFGFVFCCCFMGLLGFVFLSMFWQMAIDECDAISRVFGIVVPKRDG